MSYELARKVITNYLQAQSFYGLTPFGLDGDDIAVVAGGGYMNIGHGEARQVSIGKPDNNMHQYIGLLTVTINMNSGQGSAQGHTAADLFVDGLTGLKLDEGGVAPSASSTMVIDFAHSGFTPAIASSETQGKYHRTTINAPFVRTERK